LRGRVSGLLITEDTISIFGRIVLLLTTQGCTTQELCFRDAGPQASERSVSIQLMQIQYITGIGYTILPNWARFRPSAQSLFRDH